MARVRLSDIVLIVVLLYCAGTIKFECTVTRTSQSGPSEEDTVTRTSKRSDREEERVGSLRLLIAACRAVFRVV